MTKLVVKYWKYSLAFGGTVTLAKKLYYYGFSLDIFSIESALEIFILSLIYLLLSIAFNSKSSSL